MADQQEIQQIKERIDIVSLISRYIETKSAGKNFQARCPFHAEKSPSFIVSPELQRYKCFGCQKSGDIFTFVMEYEHIDFAEAIEKLAKEAGVKLENKRKPVNKIYAILEMINQLAADYYVKMLYEDVGKKALEYIKSRDYSEEILKMYQIGYAPGRNSLLTYLQSKANFTKEQLLQSGLFTDKSGRLNDKFNNRLVFAIVNEKGKVIAFSGRVLPGNELGPKYLNSPETPIFHKKDNLFGLYFAKSNIRAEDLCILCEGQTDSIASYQAGIKNVVAPLGTALTEDQLRIISKYTKNILFLFDNDSAGQNAVERGFKISTKLNLNTYATNTGEYKDLSEMLLADKENVLKIIEHKQDAFTYLLSNKIKDLDLSNYQNYKNVIKYVEDLISNVTDNSSRIFYINKAVEITNLKADVFSNKSDKSNIQSVNKNQSPKESLEKTYIKTKQSRFTLEEYLLYNIIKFDLYKLLEKIPEDLLSDPTIIKIINIIKELKKEGINNKQITSKISDIFKNEVSDQRSFQLLEKIIFDEQKSEGQDIDSEISELLIRIKYEKNLNKLRDLRKQLSILENNPNSDEKEILQISSEITKITLDMQKFKTSK